MNSEGYRLLNAAGIEYLSTRPAQFGGHKGTKIYGRLDCSSALRWMAKGHYVKHRVFFHDAKTARSAGYRPCAVCLLAEFEQWKLTSAQA